MTTVTIPTILEHEATHMLHVARADRWTNVPVATAPRRHTAPRVRASDYPPGPFPWTEREGRACFEAHAWAGGASLAMALLMAHREARPPCWPPAHVVDAETALLVLLNKTARIKRLHTEVYA